MATIKEAREFALARHGGQLHGSVDISFHLEDVAKNVEKHGGYDEIIQAAWLHDVLEDTETKPREVFDRFGDTVWKLVLTLTDAPGKTRYERHLNTYWAIRESPDARLIKLCDRRHNHERSIAYGETHAVTYWTEYRYFKMALWTPSDTHKALWAELDAQYAELTKLMQKMGMVT